MDHWARSGAAPGSACFLFLRLIRPFGTKPFKVEDALSGFFGLIFSKKTAFGYVVVAFAVCGVAEHDTALGDDGPGRHGPKVAGPIRDRNEGEGFLERDRESPATRRSSGPSTDDVDLSHGGRKIARKVG